MEDWQDNAVGHRIEEFVGMPARGERSGLRFAITDNTGDDQVGVVVGRAVRVRDRISEFPALVDRAWRLRGHVARNTARKGELGEETLHALLVLGDVWVDLAIGSLEVGVGDQTRPAVSGTGVVEHVKVMLLDYPVQMDVYEVQAWCRSPVTQESWLDVLLAQLLL